MYRDLIDHFQHIYVLSTILFGCLAGALCTAQNCIAMQIIMPTHTRPYTACSHHSSPKSSTVMCAVCISLDCCVCVVEYNM